MATKEFGMQADQFGALGSLLAVGSLTGAIVAARLERSRTTKNILFGATLFGVLLMLSAYIPSPLLFALMLPIMGATALLTLISANTYVQSNTSNALRGRVMGIYLMIFMGGTPIGAPLIGFVAAAVGIRLTIVLCGLVLVVAAFLIKRKFKGLEPVTI
jgi:MFS family permease